MSLAEKIGPHIPYLRRYARALSGSQKSGDAYAAAALEAVINDASAFRNSGDDRSDVYHLFTKVWSSIDMNMERGAEGAVWEDIAQSNLAAIAPMARQAFLLTTVEQFSTDQTASILDVSTERVNELVAEAHAEIENQVRTEILIIEDEPLISMDIEEMVKSLGHGVIGTARTHSEALEIVAERKPGLVLADIQLADGSSGIDAVNDMLSQFSVPVIFITAFPERLLTGERPEPAFLVTKPFEPDMVKALISQALFFQQEAQKAA